MPNYDDDELKAMLIGAGVLALFGYGLYKVLKSIGGHKVGDVITENEISSLPSSTYHSSSSLSDYYEDWPPDDEGDDLEDED